MKADMYTKIVLTVIAVFLGILIIKDVDFVTKAQAAPAEIDLSALNIEKAESSNENEMTFFIYENSKIKQPFSKSDYEECKISQDDVPIYIITNMKTGSNSIFGSYIRINKTK